MVIWRFAKDLSWWSKVFPQQPYAPIAPSPSGVLDVVQPTFDVLGSCKHLAKSLYSIAGAANAAVVTQAIAVPADELWVVESVVANTDDGVAQWCYLQVLLPSGSTMPYSGKVALPAGQEWVKLLGPADRFYMQPATKLQITCNSPSAGKLYNLVFVYTPLKVGEMLPR